MLTQVCAGLALEIPEGWELQVQADEELHCDQIELSKGSARVAIEVIASSTNTREFADSFRFFFLGELVEAGCQVKSPMNSPKGWILADHPDFEGPIMHLIRTGAPLLHISAASMSDKRLQEELITLGESIVLDNTAWDLSDSTPGSVLPMKLVAGMWERH